MSKCNVYIAGAAKRAKITSYFQIFFRENKKQKLLIPLKSLLK